MIPLLLRARVHTHTHTHTLLWPLYISACVQWRKSGWNSGGCRADPDGLLGVGCGEAPEKNEFFT